MPKPPPPSRPTGFPPRASSAELLQQGLRLHQAGKGADAAGYYQRVLDREPSQPAANHLLGVIRLQQGRHDDAIRLIRRAIAAHGTDPQYHMNLGVALNAAGRSAEAVDAFRRALALKPDLAGAHSNLGMALRALGDLDASAESYRRAVELAPAEPTFHFNLANTLSQLGDTAAATAGYVEALRLRPVYPPALAGLAQLNEAISRDAESLRVVDQLLAGNRSVAEYHMTRGRVLYRLRRLEDAAAALAEAIRLKPAFGEPRFHLANMTRAPSDGEVGRLQSIAADASLSLDDRVYAGFALGRVLSDLDRHDDSILAYEAANALQRKRLSYSVEAVRQQYDALLAPFEAAPDVLLAGGHRGPSPIFIIGLPRSGKSTIESILARHPDVSAAGELPIFERLLHGAGLLDRKDPTAADFAVIGRAYVEEVDRIVGRGLRSIDTMPPNDRLVGYVRAALPDAVIIHATRNHASQKVALFEKFLPRAGYEYARDPSWLAEHLAARAHMIERWRRIVGGSLVDFDVGAESDSAIRARRLLTICGLDWHPDCGEAPESEPVLADWPVAHRQGNAGAHLEAWQRLRPVFLNVSA